MSKYLFAVILVCMALFGEQAVASPVIQNGGFEADPSGANVVITGWDHDGSTFSGSYHPHTGNINAVLTALHDVNQFTQMIPETTSGELFTVTFFLAPGYIYPGKTSIFDVSFGGSTLEILSSRFAALGEYQEFDITGVGGPGDVTDLIFSVPQFVGDPFGTYDWRLDDVSIAAAVVGAVPEPSTLLLAIPGLAACCSLVRRRRRGASPYSITPALAEPARTRFRHRLAAA